MALRVLRTSDGGVIVANLPTKPAATVTVTKLNYVTVSCVCDLMDTVADIYDCFAVTDKDYKTMCDAMRQVVIDIGAANPVPDMTDEAAGIDYLVNNDFASAERAVQHGIGSGTQLGNIFADDNSRFNIVDAHMRANFDALKRRAFIFNALMKSCAGHILQANIPIVEKVKKDLDMDAVTLDELSGNALDNMVMRGVMGKVDTGWGAGIYTGVLDYINETVGTRYESAGFLTRYGSLELPDVMDTGGGEWLSFKNLLFSQLAYGNIDTIEYT